MVKLANTPDLGSGGVILAGSSPVTRTRKNLVFRRGFLHLQLNQYEKSEIQCYVFPLKQIKDKVDYYRNQFAEETGININFNG